MKKPPPLRPEKAEDCCGVEDLFGTGFRLENAEFCGLFGLDTLEKPRLLNASVKPPIEEEPVVCWLIGGGAVGACMPPKEPEWE